MSTTCWATRVLRRVVTGALDLPDAMAIQSVETQGRAVTSRPQDRQPAGRQGGAEARGTLPDRGGECGGGRAIPARPIRCRVDRCNARGQPAAASTPGRRRVAAEPARRRYPPRSDQHRGHRGELDDSPTLRRQPEEGRHRQPARCSSAAGGRPRPAPRRTSGVRILPSVNCAAEEQQRHPRRARARSSPPAAWPQRDGDRADIAG